MVHREIVQKLMQLAGKTNFERCLQKVKIVAAADGKCDAELKIDKEHTNVLGTLHGGMAATLVDIISSYALLTHPKFVNTLETFPTPSVSVDLHMTYLRSAKIGEEVLIQANTIKAGKTLAFLDVTLLNKDTGSILVKGSHTKFILL